MARATIYRNGELTVGSHGEYILTHWGRFDAARPEGSNGRLDSLYAAPDIHGGSIWLTSTHVEHTEPKMHAITVDPDKVKVYDVRRYNRVPYDVHTPRDTEKIKAYWDSAMTLTEWQEKVGKDEYGHYEILLDPKDIISAKPLTRRQLVNLYKKNELSDYRLSDLNRIFR